MRNHTSKQPFSCAQCNLGFKVKADLLKHCESAHNGFVLLHETSEMDQSASMSLKPDEKPEIVTKIDENGQNQEQTTVIQYIYEDGETFEATRDGNAETEAQYTVVNISDVSAFQNAHTVVEEPKNATRVLSSTVNEDGTTTYMVTAEPEHQAIDDKTVVFLRISDGNEETT